MAASVQDLILAANAKRDESPLISLAKALAGGVDAYQSSKSSAIQDLVRKTGIQAQIQQMQMQQAAEQRKAMQRAKDQAEEQALKESFKSVGGASPAVMPQQKLTKVRDEEGNVTTSTTYGSSEDGLNDLLASKVKSGEMSLAEAFAMKNRSGGGLSNELIYRMGQDQQKAAKESKAKEIPGYARTGSVELDETETRKLREGVPEFETFKTAINDYKKLIETFGTSEISDRGVQGQMNALAKNLQLKVKNLAQLGVLSASDIPFIEEQIPTPGVFRTKDGMLGALKTAEKLMQTAIDNKMKIGGYESQNVANPSTQIQPGHIEDGYRFKGGNPADPKNWEKQ